ncbi:hypothetical protein BCY86_08605 [Pajaroellobacter abortibovis]|uniref:Uncharacterized protein n=1 Tax=Pajaroellobacter abortibovis TaxID=1882918 RepID=A0A1L6MZ10_9BACT|nr:hypothetical protein BCY86_08605 [Pajaroellobacter abortibovis]
MESPQENELLLQVLSGSSLHVLKPTREAIYSRKNKETETIFQVDLDPVSPVSIPTRDRFF